MDRYYWHEEGEQTKSEISKDVINILTSFKKLSLEDKADLKRELRKHEF